MITKRVMQRKGYEGPWIVLATFRMDGSSLVAAYEADGYQDDLENNGIGCVVDGKFRILHPSDGQAFFDALSTVYSQSTLMDVLTTDDDDVDRNRS
jgi:hypothetical protein